MASPKKEKNTKKVSHDLHFRVKNVKTLDMITECLEKGKFKSNNDLYNLCLEIALPQIIENSSISGEYVKSSLRSLENKLLSKFDREFTKLKKEVTKELVIQHVNQAMLSTILQSFIMYAETQGVTINEKMQEDFAENLPEMFDKMFYELGKNLLNIPD